MTQDDWVYGILMGVGAAFLILMMALIGIFVALLLSL